jgi:hypothetical protein
MASTCSIYSTITNGWSPNCAHYRNQRDGGSGGLLRPFPFLVTLYHLCCLCVCFVNLVLIPFQQQWALAHRVDCLHGKKVGDIQSMSPILLCSSSSIYCNLSDMTLA